MQINGRGSVVAKYFVIVEAPHSVIASITGFEHHSQALEFYNGMMSVTRFTNQGSIVSLVEKKTVDTTDASV